MTLTNPFWFVVASILIGDWERVHFFFFRSSLPLPVFFVCLSLDDDRLTRFLQEFSVISNADIRTPATRVFPLLRPGPQLAVPGQFSNR